MSAVGSPSSDRKRKREDEDTSAPTKTIVNQSERSQELALKTAITQICSTTTFLQDDFDDMNKEALREILRDSPGALNHFLGGFSSPARKDLSSPKKYLHTVLSAVRHQLNSHAGRVFSKYYGLGLDRHHRGFVLRVMKELGNSVGDKILRDVSRIFPGSYRMRNRNALLTHLLQQYHRIYRTKERLSAIPTDNVLKDFIQKNEYAALEFDRLSNYGGSQLSDSHIEECFGRITELQGRYPDVPLGELFILSLQFERTIIHLRRRHRVLARFQAFLQKQKEFNFDDPRVLDARLQKQLLSVVDNLNDDQCTLLFDFLDDRFRQLKTKGVLIRNPQGFLMSSLNEMSDLVHDHSVGDSLFESLEWKQLQSELSTNGGTEPLIGDRIPREIQRLLNHLVKEGEMSHLRVRGIIAEVLQKLKKPRFSGLNPAHKAVIHFLRSHPQNQYFNKNDSGENFADICTKMMPALNGKQAEAVDASISSPLLINAGPGTGKTNTLVARIFRLLASGKRPHQIIAITFSNEAQRSLLNRIEETLGRYGGGNMSLYFPFVKTIDAFAAMICDCYLSKPTIILDDDNFMSRVIRELESDPVYGHCHTLEAIVTDYYTKLKLPADNDLLQSLERIHEKYMNLGIATHRTRLMWVIKFLEKNQKVLRHYQLGYHVLVDEFQDVDNLQNTFIRLIAPPSPPQKKPIASTITVVGDDDQAIYAFRGGSIEPIQKFAQIYEESKPAIVSLIENYRSIQSIIDFNCRFISKLEPRAKAGVEFLSKASLPDVSNHAQGESDLKYGVHLCSSANFTTALDHTLNHMEDFILTRKIEPSKIAVLVYSNAECDDITYGCRLRRLKIAEEDISDGILVSTFHKAKGLEREIVFVLWCYPYSWEPDTMRLFYVACTRAKYLLHINLYIKFGYADNRIFEAIGVQVSIDTECQLTVDSPSKATDTGENDSTELLDDIDETLLKFLVPEIHESSPPEDVESSVHDNYTVNVSSLASFFLFQCGRRLYRQMKRAPPNCVQKVTTESSVSKMLKDAGLKWEERIVDWLKHKKILGYDRWKGDDVSILMRSIADSHGDQYLYEPSIPVSSEICRAIGLPVQITIRTIRPDFIKLKSSPAGIRSLQIIDAKFSSQPKVYQKIQVALYCLILQEMIRRLGFSNRLAVDPLGGIWLPPDKNITTHPLQDSDFEDFISYFDTIYLKAPIKTYLEKHISHVLVEGEDDYHLTRVCSSCEHSDTCIKDATAGRKHLSLLPVINRSKRKELLASNICDIEDIIEKSLPAAVAKSYPGIVTMASSIHRNEIALLGHGSSTLPFAEDIRIVFLSISHPVHNTVVFAGLLFQDNEKGDIKLYPYDSQTLLVQELHQYLMYVSECNRGGAQRSLQVYAYSMKDKMALLRMHVNALSIPELRSKAEASLRVLFLERNLATVQDQHQDPSKVDFTVICVEQEMRSLFALPLPLLTEFSYIYKLFGGKKDVKSDEYLQTEYISEPSLSDQVLLNQIVALSELIDSVRKRIVDAIPVIRPGQQAHIKSRFRQLKPFKMIEPMQFNHPVFSKLAFLRLRTASANSNDLQRGRYRSFGLLLPWKVTITAIESTVCEGVLARGSVDRTMDDFNDCFTDFFMVDLEDGAQVEELLRFKDIHYASEQSNRINETLRSSNSKLFVAKLQPTDSEFGVRLTLPKDRELKLNYTYGLFQRFTDFTLSRSLDELKKVDQSPERSRNFLAALNGSLNTTESDSFNLSECWSPTDNNQLWVWGDDKELGVFMDLTPAHVRVLDNLRSYVMSLMIGPPGTGKSFFLAGLLLARLRHSLHTRQKTVIIVTANMHSAMDSILEKVTSLLSGTWLASQSAPSVKKHIIRLAKAGDEKLFKNVVGYVGSDSLKKLRKLIENGEQVIILGTIWQLLKVRKVIRDFNIDMLCVDESSMMPMIETTLAFSLTANQAKRGSILLVGDHKQLGPVNKSNYNDDYCQEVEVITVEKSLFHHILSAQPAAPSASLSIPSATLTHTWRLNQTACYFVATYMQYDGYEPANDLIGSQRFAIRRTTALHNLERAARSLKRSLAVALHPAKSLVTIVLKSSKEGSNVVGREDLLECKFVGRMVQVLSNSTSLADDTNPRILTLVPHHKKRRLLKGEFSEGLTEPMTIYQAQGKECDICVVLYSMHDPSDIDRQREFIFSPFMFNVAITRARLKTIVVVTDHMLEAFPSALEDPIVEHGYKIIRSFHDYCEEAGSVVNIELSDLVDQQDELPVQQLRSLDVGS